MKAQPNLIDGLLKEGGYKHLGWANGWRDRPEELLKCIELKHERDYVAHDKRGFENTASCDICKIYYKYDSSD
jgi:hypothetical protein